MKNPAITNYLRTGWPGGKEPPVPVCPVCGEECLKVYRLGKFGRILGCDECLTEQRAWDAQECFEEDY